MCKFSFNKAVELFTTTAVTENALLLKKKLTTLRVICYTKNKDAMIAPITLLENDPEKVFWNSL